MKRPVVITLLVAALLFVLAGIGAVAYFAINNGGNFVFDQSLASATAEESKSLKVDEPVTLKVDDDAGSVTIVGGDVEKVEVKVVKTGNASTQSRAEENLKKIKYEIKQDGNNVTLLYKLSKISTNHVDTVDFIVTVPNETTVNIETNLGKVNVSDTKGNVVIVNDFGSVTVENIEGALSIKNDSGEVQATAIKAGSADIDLHSGFGEITLTRASGANITLDSSSGTITLDDVRATGDLITKSDFGDTKYENGSADSLNVETNSGKVSLVKLKVSKELKVDNDFGEIELNQAFAGSYDLHTNSGSITVDGAKNKLKAYTDFGGITIENAQSVTLDLKTNSGTVQFSGSLGEGPHTIKSDFGGIDLTLPADSKLNVDLKTDFGGIGSDIPLTVTLDGSSDKNHQVGTMNGGGDQLTVITNSGGINIKAIK
jgi:DUF4097 and DUF4098 domain-containing protein YvlB